MVHLAVVYVRNRLYDAGILRSHRLPRPVVSVGNVQIGGTGKTPLVRELIRLLEDRGYRVAVLTRGYRRRSREPLIVKAADNRPAPAPGDERLSEGGAKGGKISPEQIGDEPALLLSALRRGVLGVGRQRHKVGAAVLGAAEVDLFLLDDGFQHRRLHRDVDICLIDVSRWPGHPFLFPLSSLRDARSSLRRAHVIILTKYEQCSGRADALEASLRRRYRIPVLRGGYQVVGWERLISGKPVPVEKLQGRPVMAVCGIANPGHFVYLLGKSGLSVNRVQAFGDHHHYTVQEVQALMGEARRQGIDHLVVTEKDAVKLRGVLNSYEEIGERIIVCCTRFRVEGMDDLWQRVLALFPEQRRRIKTTSNKK